MTEREPARVTDATRVELCPLSMREEDDRWVVGRVDLGEFISVPPVAHRVLTLLNEGHTVGEVARLVRDEVGEDVAVDRFVIALDELHFVRAMDGQPRANPTPPPSNLAWLQPRHVSWLLHPAMWCVVAAMIAAGLVTLLWHPELMPSYRDLVWSPYSGLVLAGNALVSFVMTGLHEFAHLATARAAGAPARMSFGTRLQFLVVQTDVSGVWAAPRRARITVYLAGIAVNFALAALFVLLLAILQPPESTARLLRCAALLAIAPLSFQLLIFMRTDIYFLVQDLSRCPNLYAEGSAYLRYLARRARAVLRPSASPPPNPTKSRPRRERRAVQAYSWVLLIGTVTSIAVAATVGVPAAIVLIGNAIVQLTGPSVTTRLDASAALLVVGGMQLLWMRAWWRRHGGRVRDWIRGRADRVQEGGAASGD